MRRALRLAPPVLFLVILGYFATTSSCKKKECPSEGIITVVDASGKPVVGAVVTLYCDTTSGGCANGQLAAYLPDKKTTDGSGKSYHSFKYPTLLFIEVTKPGDTTVARSYIKLEKCETTEKTVIFQ